MSTPAFPIAPRRRPWLAVALASAVLVAAGLPAGWQAAATLHPALGLVPWWAAWTAHAVHWGPAHAAVDALALLLTAALAEQLLPRRWLALALLPALPALSAGIVLLEPQLAAYRGASGLAMALAVLDWALLRRAGAGRGFSAVWWLAGLAGAVKLALEMGDAWRGEPASGLGLPPAVALAWSAHAAGVGVGLALAAAARARQWWPRPPG